MYNKKKKSRTINLSIIKKRKRVICVIAIFKELIIQLTSEF